MMHCTNKIKKNCKISCKKKKTRERDSNREREKQSAQTRETERIISVHSCFVVINVFFSLSAE